MGTSKSKLAVLSYEDAEKRLSEKELNRLKRAFNQLAPKGTLSLEKFYSEVFGEFLPFSICEIVFKALKIGSNSNGISFKELLIGIIILTAGSYEEKCKFIFSLYCNESGTGIEHSTLQSALDDVSDISDLHMAHGYLDETNILPLDNFMKWIGQCPKFNEITYWLLLLDCRQPFLTENNTPQDLYQLVAGVTHLEESEVIQLERTYQRLVANLPRRTMNINGFSRLVSPPLPENIVEKVFLTFDENDDGSIDLRELACGISACTRGPTIERKKFCCKIFDDDKDGRLGPKDIELIFSLCNELKNDEVISSPNANAKTDRLESICHNDLLTMIMSSKEMTTNKTISIDDFLIWMNDYDFIDPLMELLNQICTVVFSLKPQTGLEEEQIITKWLRREEKSRSIEHSGFYIISRMWLKQWLCHIRCVAKENDTNSVPNGLTTFPKVPYSKSLNNVLPLVRKHQYDLTKSNKVPTRVKSSDELVGRYTLHTSIDGACNSVDMIYPDLASRLEFGSYTGSNPSISSFSSTNSFQDLSPTNKLVPISNQCLLNTKIVPVNPNIVVYTDDGGILDHCLKLGEDFELIPAPIWNCLKTWYGGGPTILRPLWIECRSTENKNPNFDDNCIILHRNQNTLKIEIHLLTLFIVRHVIPTLSSAGTVASLNKIDLPSSMMTSNTGLTTTNLNNQGTTFRNVTIPKKQVRGRVSLSRRTTLNELIEFLSSKLNICKEEMRIWKIIEENNLLLLEDEERSLMDLELQCYDKILVEQRNIDLTWPEELNQLAKIRSLQNKKASSFKGVTGLSNVGNTCFFNSALQCISNTNILTDYFIRDLHLCELNRTNVHGCHGMVALRYAELMKDIWSGSSNLIVPLKLKMTIDRYVRQFSGNQQHDAQEFLSALLDLLHEDLNRVTEKPSYKELKDSDGRNDAEVAAEAWQSHIESNQSIIVDLFHGLLRSNVCCDLCKNDSVRFDAYSMLSLPIPMQTSLEIDILVFHRDSPIPRKHCVIVTSIETTPLFIRQQLAAQLSVQSHSILLTLVEDGKIKKFLSPSDKILITQTIYAYIVATDDGEDIDANNNDVKEAVTFVIYQRRMIPRDDYFLAHSRMVREIFGFPLMFTVTKDHMRSLTNKDIYKKVLVSIDCQNDLKSFVTDLKNSIRSLHQISNHAVDCDSLDHVQPFKLSRIVANGRQCNQCHWSRFCRGCPIPCSNDIYEPWSVNLNFQYIALDWSPAALHLKFNTENEKMFIYDANYKEIKALNNQPMDLLKCIEMFTTEETLSKDTLYQCTKCKKPQPAHKKLDLWTLPPVLIVHLKRFQFVDSKWQKSHKVVYYPIRNLDLSNFVKASTRCKSDDDAVGPLQSDDASCSTYNLYAVNCHLGHLQMGHYITYAKNKETGKWYMFNDSICKEVNEKDVNTNSAYLLFYERANVDFEKVLDGLVVDKVPVVEAVELAADEVETDIKRTLSSYHPRRPLEDWETNGRCSATKSLRTTVSDHRKLFKPTHELI